MEMKFFSSRNSAEKEILGLENVSVDLEVVFRTVSWETKTILGLFEFREKVEGGIKVV